MKERWRLIAIIVGAVVLLGAGVGLAVTTLREPAPVEKVEKKEPKKENVVKEPEPEQRVDPVDGLPADKEIIRPLAIMVENLTTIRPQSGPGEAGLVVEGLAEGGITRFMLVFGTRGSDNVGPIRSARTHFVSLARGWQAIYAHVGGSKYALNDIKRWGVFDWDQSVHGGDYTRVSSARAPHNVFTSTKRLRDAAAAKETKTTPAQPLFKFKAAPKLDERPEGFKSIVVGYPETGYGVEYQYDRPTNTYMRFNGGRPHTDVNTEKQLAPTNIVVVRAAHSAIFGGSGVLDVNMTGSGEATVFRDGQVIEGTWERADVADPIVLTDVDGAQIELTAGQTWMEIVEPTTPLHIQR